MNEGSPRYPEHKPMCSLQLQEGTEVGHCTCTDQQVRARGLTLPPLKGVGFSVQRGLLSKRESDTLSLGVQKPKFPRSGVPRPTYLAGQSHDCPDNEVGGQLGYRKATSLVPSTFYDTEDFPIPTGKVEFPKNGLLRGSFMLSAIG